MKISEQWLREWVDPNVSVQELAERLTMAGLEVDGLTAIGKDLQNIRVGEVLDAQPHPNADRLQVCQVSVGDITPLTIVCGAKNVRAGLKVAVALVGAVLPGDIKIKRTKIRGVESSGMLCSAVELGLGEGEEGVIELPSDAPVGGNLNEYMGLPDHLLEINITPNRGDCLSIKGVARELGVLYQLPVQMPHIQETPPATSDKLPIKVIANAGCPYYVGRIIRGLNPKATTPLWLQQKLSRHGARSIHPIVDITNYVMLELGQPLHAFDLSSIVGEIQVRLSYPSERVTLLDGQTLTFNEPALVITDTQKILALAGIMGSASSAVTSETVDIFIESAFFSPSAIRPTLRRLLLQSDAAHRFERGVDPRIALQAMHRVTQLILDICGGNPGPITEVLDPVHFPKPTTILLRDARIEKVLGIKIPASTIEDILQRLEMEVVSIPEGWQVTPPSHRFDINMEVDLMEEIARIYGYDRIPSDAMHASLVMQPVSEHTLTEKRLRTYWVDRGYREVINYSFVDPKLSKLLDPNQSPLRLSNPISVDMAVMRTSLWPGLLKSVLFNLNRQQSHLRFFEIGVCFISKEDELTQQPYLGGIVAGTVCQEQWGLPSRSVDFFDLKGDIESLVALTGKLDQLHFMPSVHPALHPGRCAVITVEDEFIGYLGELHPHLQQELELQIPIYLFELSLQKISATALPVYAPPSKYPHIRRDLAFIVEDRIAYEQIRDTIRRTANEALKNIQLFDIYRGEGIAPGRKSIALSLTFQLASRTLTDQEVDEVINRIIHGLKQNFQAILRE